MTSFELPNAIVNAIRKTAIIDYCEDFCSVGPMYWTRVEDDQHVFVCADGYRFKSCHVNSTFDWPNESVIIPGTAVHALNDATSIWIAPPNPNDIVYIFEGLPLDIAMQIGGYKAADATMTVFGAHSTQSFGIAYGLEPPPSLLRQAEEYIQQTYAEAAWRGEPIIDNARPLHDFLRMTPTTAIKGIAQGNTWKLGYCASQEMDVNVEVKFRGNGYAVFIVEAGHLREAISLWRFDDGAQNEVLIHEEERFPVLFHTRDNHYDITCLVMQMYNQEE